MLTPLVALILSAAPVMVLADDPEPPAKAPTVRYLRTEFHDQYRCLIFEVTNTTKKPVSFQGSGGMKEYPTGSGILPIYKVQQRKAKAWQAATPHLPSGKSDWKTIQPGAKVTFPVWVVDESWQTIRVGFLWFNTAKDRTTAQTTWSSETNARERRPQRPR